MMPTQSSQADAYPSPPSDHSQRTPLQRLLDPHSIVVVGASADSTKRGFQALRALLDSGFKYPVYAVNPRGGRILDHPVLRSIEELPPRIDVALITTPARAAPEVVRHCARAGIGAAVVVANGFRESGSTGAQLEGQLRAVVAETSIRVVGPNTSGILNTATRADLVGLGTVREGPISVIAQSGNMLLSLLADDRQLDGPGFDVCVGLGNQSDVGYAECLEYLADRETTGAIAIYLENFREGRALLAAAASASRKRPIVLLRGGRSESGKRAVLSHTGSVAASDRLAAGLLRQAGIELVDRSDELAPVARPSLRHVQSRPPLVSPC